MVPEVGMLVAVRVPERAREHRPRRALAGQERCSRRGSGRGQTDSLRKDVLSVSTLLSMVKTTTADTCLSSKAFRRLLIKRHS